MLEKTLSEVLTIYKEKVSIQKKGYKQEVSRINQIMNSFIGQKEISKITSVDIAKYRDYRLSCKNPKTQKPLTGSTVRLELSLLSNLFDISIIEWGYAETNPVSKIRKPKTSKGRERRLLPREENKILRYAKAHKNEELFTIIILAIETAMRQGEIINLKWEDVDLTKSVVALKDTKNGTNRDVPMSVRAKDSLINIGIKRQGNIFNYTSAGIKSTWRFMIIKLGIKDLHFHDLRHEATSRFFELGTLDIMEISAITGHKSLSMLKRYTHLKAHTLVKKLEGKKNKAKQAISKYLIPYPAEVTSDHQVTTIRFLDFNDLVIRTQEEKFAITIARNALLQTIVSRILASEALPQPDHYTEMIPEERILMIDPVQRSISYS